MSTRSAIEAGELHDEAFGRDPFPVWERLRHEAPMFQEGLIRQSATGGRRSPSPCHHFAFTSTTSPSPVCV